VILLQSVNSFGIGGIARSTTNSDVMGYDTAFRDSACTISSVVTRGGGVLRVIRLILLLLLLTLILMILRIDALGYRRWIFLVLMGLMLVRGWISA
jgi:hypothetical protein